MNEHQPGNTTGVLGLLPESDTTDRKKAGGTHTHKPGCQCNPCKARARSQEALPEPDGGGGTPESGTDVVRADELIVAPVTRRTTKYQRSVIAEWIKLRTIEPDITNLEISKRLGLHKQYLYRTINQAVKEGWLTFDDPLARIEHEVIPKALDTISQSLDAGDKKVAIEVAKGTIFPMYKDSKGVVSSGTNIAIALKVELPEGIQPSEVIDGQIIGRPKVSVEP